jgi:hypothetical protein
VRSKALVVVTALLVVFYAVLIGEKAFALFGTGEPVPVLLGVGILLVPVLGVALVAREVVFGRDSARLARDLAAEGGLPVDDLPRRPSGRVDRRAADEAFDEMRRVAEQHPDDWRAWFRLALAYDAAGDRTRARAAARHAIALHDPG